jgi:hypothetical protein
MGGLTDLNELISGMNPQLDHTDYIFSTLKKEPAQVLQYDPWAVIREDEGITVIVTAETARKYSLDYEGLFKRITLNVHSSLHAVGLTARVASVLAENGISANGLAGYFHDHIFVPSGRASEALELLRSL